MSRVVHRLVLLLAAVLVVAVLDPASLGGSRAEAQDSTFAPLRGFEPDAVSKPRVQPDEFAAVDVDLGAVRDELAAAPRTQGRSVRGAGLTFDVPTPEGGTERFAVQRTRLMQPALAAAHPEIATYAGRGVDDPSLTVALDVTPMGFHAAVRSPSAGRAWFVDPASNQPGTTAHLAYHGSDVEEPPGGLVEPEPVPEGPATRDVAAAAEPGGPVTQKVYRVAIVSDPTYAAYFGTENVLAEKVTLMNRVNQVYNDDLAISMVLVDGSEDLNLDTEAKATGPDGPCGSAPCYEPGDPATETPGELDGCGGALLGKNRTVLGQLIGADAYDIGHIVLGKNGGGIAYLGVVGQDYKGGGCTGLPFPTGDFFAIDYVAHEMGHQFAGPHTFNGTQANCSGGNRTGGSSVEPGSGSSVMAYAGICASDDLQPHTDPYFSQRTIDEVTAYTTDGAADDVIEVQTVSLRGFDTDGDTVTLAYEGNEVTLTRGAATYNAVTVRAAVAELTGRPVTDITVAEWDHDPYDTDTDDLAPLLAPDDRGFQVIFAPTNNPEDPLATRVDVPAITVPDAAEGFVGTTAQGGAPANDGFERVDAENAAPVVTAPADRTIPARTPFALTASGTDPDGDDLTYLWEQNDVGGAVGTALTSNAKTEGPLFRVFGKAADVSLEDSLESPSPGQNIADGTPTRSFPDLRQVLDGTTNADTGTCSTPPPPADPTDPPPLADDVRECFSEFLPTAAYVGVDGDRALDFRVTARDGWADGGGTAYDDVRLTVDPSAGPFRVTSQASGGTLDGRSQQEVTWEVNGTDELAPDVRIALSDDGGATWDYTLAARTPNDGSAEVTIPAVRTDAARIRIEALRNVFYDVNDADFTIDPGPEAPQTTITAGPSAGGFHLPPTADVTYASSDPGSSFTCTLDGSPVECGAGGVTLTGLGAGVHTFTVAATDSEGNADATPAVRRWATPVPAERLNRNGSWTRVRSDAAYRGSFLRTTREGVELRRTASGIQRLGLVVGRGPGMGRIAVFLGDERLRTVNLQADTAQPQTLVALPRFDGARSGQIRVRSLGGGPVRVEGLGILRR